MHAWLATLPIWYQRDTPPLAPNHVFNLHGPTADPADTWLMYRDDGEAWAGNGDGGIYYLDPGQPRRRRRYTTDVYMNLLRNYDVDGIHLDQVRYYEGDPLRWGYNPTSVARFNAAVRPRPGDAARARPTRSGSPGAATRSPRWCAASTSRPRRIKPNVAVTAAVVTWGRGPQTDDDWERQAPYAAVLQDWRAWLQEGIVDYLLPMDYYRENSEQAHVVRHLDPAGRSTHTGQRGVVLGLGSYLNSRRRCAGAAWPRARAGRARRRAVLVRGADADLENASYEDRLAFADAAALGLRPSGTCADAWARHSWWPVRALIDLAIARRRAAGARWSSPSLLLTLSAACVPARAVGAAGPGRRSQPAGALVA